MSDLPRVPSIPNLPASLKTPRRQNPFGPRPGEAPPYLAGRVGQIDAWARPVQELLTSGRTCAPIFFTAPRGLGKTVLLRTLQTDATEAGFVTVWVTANAVESLIAAVVSGVRSSISRKFSDDARDLLKRLDSLKVTSGIPGVLQVEASTRPEELHEVTLAVEVAALARSFRERGTAGLMLFVDELQSARHEDLAALVPALQEWTAGSAGLPLSFVGAGPIQLSRVLAAHGGFAERFQYVALERLSDMDAMAAFTLGLPSAFEWLPGSLDAAIRAAEGHPYVIQLIGHYAWDASGASTIERPFFTTADIDLAEQKAREEIRRVFEGRWIDTSEAERVTLGAVADAADARLSRAQIASSSGMVMRDVEAAVDSLYANGWLDVDGLEQVRIGLPGVREFVLERMQPAPEPP